MDRYVNKNYRSSELTSKIINLCFSVHNDLGSGYQEVIYQRALGLELQREGIPYAREEWLDVHYKTKVIGKRRVDFVIGDCILETKAKCEFDPQDYMQLIAYLKATGYKIGLLVNFGSKKVEVKRFANHA